MKVVTEISFPKWILVLIAIIVLALLYFSGAISFSKALPYQQCGGSTLDAKKCISGFECEPPTRFGRPPPPGVGGTCVLIK